MPRNHTKRWKTMDDADQYVRDLEEVYGMDITMDIHAAEGLLKGERDIVRLTSVWKGDDPDTGPLCFHEAFLPLGDQAIWMSALVRALTDFTYQCLECYISAIPAVVVVRLRR